MKSTPSSIARRSTASASAASRGGPQPPAPVICIAPNPRRWTERSPRRKVLIGSIEQIHAEDEHDHEDQREDQKDPEQDLGDARRSARDSRESQRAGDDRDDGKD